MKSADRKAADLDCGVTIRCSLFLWTAPYVFRLLCRFLRMSFFYPCPGISPQRRQASSSQTTHHLFPCRHEKLVRSVAPPLPKKSYDFLGTPLFIAQSYPIRTVIQFSICPSIGSQREGPKINPLNNQLGTFLPFARRNFVNIL